MKINDKHYEYLDNEIYDLVNGKQNHRKNVTYARVSLNKQKDDLERQNQRLYDFAISNGYQLSEQLKDIKSGMNFTERKSFMALLKMVVQKTRID